MKFQEYLDYEKTITRRELFNILILVSIPFVGLVALIFVMIFKPHKKNSKWKKIEKDQNDS